MQPFTLDQLAAQIIKLTTGIDVATLRWLRLVAEYDDRCEWPVGELVTCVHWIEKHCGLKRTAARERLRVAHALQRLPRTSAAMAAGRVSYSKARSITRIATDKTEEQLLALAAQLTAHDLEHAIQELRRRPDKNNREENRSPPSQKPTRPSVTHTWDTDGALLLKARLASAPAKLLLHALDTAINAITTNGTNTPYTVRRADALIVLAENFLRATAPPHGSSHHEPSRAQPPPPSDKDSELRARPTLAA